MTQTYEHIRNRVERLRNSMASRKLDAMLFLNMERFGWENVYYLSGFRGSSASLLITQNDAVLVTDGRYVSQASAQSPFRVLVQNTNQTIFDLTEEMIRRHEICNCGFEGETITFKSYQSLDRIAVNQSVEFIDTAGLMTSLRRKKDELEVSTIFEAARIASRAYEKLMTQIIPGMTEMEVSNLLVGNIITMGGEGGWPNDKFIVASGVRSSMPHGVATSKKLETGDWVTVDFGAAYGAYMSDLTRNFAVGHVSDDEFVHIHDVLVEAHNRAAEAIAPGKTGKEIDHIARSIIAEAGYGEYFSHGLGHGLGLQIHESPRLSPRSTDVLVPGDIVTVEPGVYIPDRGGLRVEDDYLVTEDGYRRISHDLSQEFFVVPI